jgi:hypothetical protein
MRIDIFHWDMRATKANLHCKNEMFFLQNPYKNFNQLQTFDGSTNLERTMTTIIHEFDNNTSIKEKLTKVSTSLTTLQLRKNQQKFPNVNNIA